MSRILFIRLRLLGDIIFTLPSLQLFRAAFPKTRIYYLVEKTFRPIAEMLPPVDEVLDVPYRMGLSDLWQYRRRIRSLGFEQVVDFHSGPKSALLTFLTGAPVRVGYRTPNRNWAYTLRVSRKSSGLPLHSVENQGNLIRALGIDRDRMPPYSRLRVPPSSFVEEVLEAPGASAKKVVIHLGAKKRFRDWGEDHFFGLIDRFSRKGIRVFLIGNNREEQERGRRLAKKYPVTDLCGKISIPDLYCLVDRADLYIGADSGPLHVATLTSTPAVALYGPNLPEISGPYRRNGITVIQKELPCRPCSQKNCMYDRIKCMDDITVEEVYEKSLEYLR